MIWHKLKLGQTPDEAVSGFLALSFGRYAIQSIEASAAGLGGTSATPTCKDHRTVKSAAKPKRRTKKPAPESSASFAGVITRNLANMATVFASSGTVLICLLIAKRF